MVEEKEQLLEGKQLSIEAAFSKFLTNEALHDVSLKGTDGIMVGANRFALAARSEVFEKMFLGEFKESSYGVVELGFDGIIVKSVVQYIYTDNAEMLDCFNQTKDLSTPEDFQQLFQHANTLLSLLEASSYFNLPGLYQKAHSYASVSLENISCLAFAVFEACHQQGPPVPTEFQQLAYSTIHSSDICIENPVALGILSSATVADILQDENTLLEEFDLFQIVRCWAEADSSIIKADKLEDRASVASELIKYIHLEMIDPQTLSTQVASSGLATKDQLFDAYQSHALALQKQHGASAIKRNRLTPVWTKSKSEILTGSAGNWDTLHHKPIRTGIHQWSMETQENSNADWVGIVLSNALVDDAEDLVENDGCWLEKGGSRYLDGKRVASVQKTFHKGSTVTLTLDLLPEQEENGTLSVSVNGGSPLTLFTGLRARLDGQIAGFLPAVWCNGGGQVKFIKIERL